MPLDVFFSRHEPGLPIPARASRNQSKKMALRSTGAGPSTWTFVEGFFRHPPKRTTLKIAINTSAYASVIVEESSSSSDGPKPKGDSLIDNWRPGREPSPVCRNVIQEILDLFHRKYDVHAPPLGNTIYYSTTIQDRFDPLLQRELPSPQGLFGPSIPLPLVSRLDLKVHLHRDHRLPLQTRIVSYKG